MAKRHNEPDDYVRDAYALIEMGASMVDAETLRMVLVRLEEAGVRPPINFKTATDMRTNTTEFANRRGQPINDGVPHYNGGTHCDAWYSGGFCSCGAKHGWHEPSGRWV